MIISRKERDFYFWLGTEGWSSITCMLRQTDLQLILPSQHEFHSVKINVQSTPDKTADDTRQELVSHHEQTCIGR